MSGRFAAGRVKAGQDQLPAGEINQALSSPRGQGHGVLELAPKQPGSHFGA